MGQKKDEYGIAPAVAKRLCEWADLEAKYAKERQEKFVERDGLRDQIAGCTDESEIHELKVQCFDVEAEISELARQIKYTTQQINKTLRDKNLRAQDVIDADLLGPLVAPKPETKKHDDEEDSDQQTFADTDAEPLGFEPTPISEAIAAQIRDHNPAYDHEPNWTGNGWDQGPLAVEGMEPLKLEIGGKYVDRFEDVDVLAAKAAIDDPKGLMVQIVTAAKMNRALKSFCDLRLAAFLLDRTVASHLAFPSPMVRDGLLAIGKSAIIDTVRRISPLAAAVYERERDIAGDGDGTDKAPDGPQGGSAGRARKRDEAAGRKNAAKKKAGKRAGKSAKAGK